MAEEKKTSSYEPHTKATSEPPTATPPSTNTGKLSSREVFGTLSMDVLQLTQPFPPKERARPQPPQPTSQQDDASASNAPSSNKLSSREVFGTLSMDVLQLTQPFPPASETPPSQRRPPSPQELHQALNTEQAPFAQASSFDEDDEPSFVHKPPPKEPPSRLPLILAASFGFLVLAAVLFWFRHKIF